MPYHDLTDEQKRLIVEGVPERKFGGLQRLLRLARAAQVQDARPRVPQPLAEPRPCPACHGARLRPEALAVRDRRPEHRRDRRAARSATPRRFFDAPRARRLANRRSPACSLEQITARLGYLEPVGLGYLTLDRPLRTLSGGERQRVALTSALGSSLVNMLYVLDEPSVGLHPARCRRAGARRSSGLRDRGNTVVVVEHEEAMIRAADQVVEIGPGAGERGGQVVFQGTPAEIVEHPRQRHRRLSRRPPRHRRRTSAAARPTTAGFGSPGARGNNLKNLTVEFPLGVLCLVTGVSGSGKSTLVEDTLYPAALPPACASKPRGRCRSTTSSATARSTTWCWSIKAPSAARRARTRSPTSRRSTRFAASSPTRSKPARATTPPAISASTSTAAAARACEGDGYLAVDMQFLADVYMKCPECHGRRYRKEILEVTYRGRNIADVLEMTVREAFTFFRGSTKVQARLKQLIDVGLDYLRLGQPANTLSGGEAQRLKLAGYMSAAKRSRTLFILDEPTTGLHFADVAQLLDCFDALLAVGHSLIVVEHNLQLMKAADWLIDLGPGAADDGGQVVATGTPEEVANNPRSITGRFLRDAHKKPLSLLGALRDSPWRGEAGRGRISRRLVAWAGVSLGWAESRGPRRDCMCAGLLCAGSRPSHASYRRSPCNPSDS